MESAKTPLQIRLTSEVLTKLDRYRQQFPFAPSRADVALKALDDWLDRQAQAPVDAHAPEVPAPSLLPVAEDGPPRQAREPASAGSRRAQQPPAGDKAEVLAQVATWQAEGLSLNAIARRLNEQHRPTLSGRGTWKAGTVSKWLAQKTSD